MEDFDDFDESSLDLDGDGDDAMEMCLFFDDDDKASKKKSSGKNSGCCVIFFVLVSPAILVWHIASYFA